MKESLNNIAIAHMECTDKRKAEWQAANVNTKIKVGDYVKIGFPFKNESGGDSREHMWVAVTSVDGKKFKGTLENDPLFIDAVFGSNVEFTFDEIENLMTK